MSDIGQIVTCIRASPIGTLVKGREYEVVAEAPIVGHWGVRDLVTGKIADPIGSFPAAACWQKSRFVPAEGEGRPNY
jgi:hypothetical protein